MPTLAWACDHVCRTRDTRALIAMSPHDSIRRVRLEDVIDLRHRVLREGLPRQAAIFDGDDDPAARHYGAFEGGRLIGCATLHLNRWDGQPAWQLRGMAVAEGLRSRGIGRRLLAFIDEDLADSPTRLLWCNARVPARSFYQKLSWQVVSDVFEIPTAGPHVKMIKRPAAPRRS